jgi:hypothetical protein
MSDEIVIKAKSTTDIKNGSIIVSVQETGSLSGVRIDPDVNKFVPSGTMFSRLHTRFDEHYGGGVS